MRRGRKAAFRTAAATAWTLSWLVSRPTTPALAFGNGAAGCGGPRRARREETRLPLPRGAWRAACRGGGTAAATSSGTRRAASSPASTSSQGAASVVEDASIEIRYCPGCRWTTKAFWMATELLQNPEFRGQLRQVTVAPAEPGTFLVTARVRGSGGDAAAKSSVDEGPDNNAYAVQLWDRKADGGFPPVDLIEFERRVARCLDGDREGAVVDDGADLGAGAAAMPDEREEAAISPSPPSRVAIAFGPDFLLRASYYGQELLTTFAEGELRAVSLTPLRDASAATSGFTVELRRDSCWQPEAPSVVALWDTAARGRFPEVKELKRLVRDVVTPMKDLGHSDERTRDDDGVDGDGDGGESLEAAKHEETVSDDVSSATAEEAEIPNISEDDGEGENHDPEISFMDDDEAEEARRYFGVM